MPASSKKQQKFMGMVHGVQKGEVEPSKVSKKVKDVAKTIKKSDAKDFASTKHKGLPTKVKEENMDELFEQLNNELNESRIKKIARKIIKESGLPQNVWNGRLSNNHSMQSKELKRDKDGTNFERTKDISGQPDLEEHHEEYPDEVLKVSVGDFLEAVKDKDEDLYHSFEEIIDSFLGKGEGEESVNEGGGYDVVLKQYHGGKFKGNIVAFFMTPKAHKFAEKSKAEKVTDKHGNPILAFKLKDLERVKKAFKNYGLAIDHVILNKESMNESSMSDIDLLASEATDFKSFLKTVKKEYPKMQVNKESIKWLESIFKEKKNESVNEVSNDKFDELSNKVISTGKLSRGDSTNKILQVAKSKVGTEIKKTDLLVLVQHIYHKLNESVNELASFSVSDLIPNAIPSSQRQNKELHKDLAKALNAIFKKHSINLTIKESMNEGPASMNLKQAIASVIKITKDDRGIIQHVNKVDNGKYVVEDWFDSGNTVASFVNL